MKSSAYRISAAVPRKRGFTSCSNHSSGDQVWYNPGDGQFYVTSTDSNGNSVLGVIDAETATWRQNVPVGRAIRNVSAFAGNNHVYVASVAPPAGTPDTSVCAGFGFVGVGCIAVFTH
jgi:hypothetical protein